MKNKFEGKISHNIPENWNCGGWLGADILRAAAGASDAPFRCVTHPNYQSLEYDIKLNVFTYGQLKLNLPFTVIAPPLSIDQPGFEGDFTALARDYSRRPGVFLALNLPAPPDGFPAAPTLPSCVFDNVFPAFDDYMSALRAPYRRRNLAALKKGAALQITQIRNADFSNDLLQLYLNVKNRSKYPLETLTADFFRRFPGEIFAFRLGKTPAAFAALRQTATSLDFVLGGMNYALRDQLDLYYNILLFILRLGIETRAKTINFGQTAESSKLRIGCRILPKYMSAFSGNVLLNAGIKRFGGALGYSGGFTDYRCFRD